ncbi:MAG: AmmeMemoRadiSam system protein B [Helicobacteraceae bacterium]|nr:AmmeMemoRadiSam system protein B [Helicobacteraceae bacterium]
MCSKLKITQLFLLFLLVENIYALRATSVAGSFYTNDKTKLSTQVKNLLKNSPKQKKESINALIVPHAGYIFSADVAAIAYKSLNNKYKNIFLIGSSHYVNFNGASIYNQGNYQTPLGVVKVNTTLATKLIKSSKEFIYEPNAHKKEHSLEVQLPFLQTIYGEDLNIVPIIIATSEYKTISKIAKTLSPYFNEQNLFVISSDLSHYPSFQDANIQDRKILNAIATNSPENFVKALATAQNSNVKALKTSACGWSSVLTLLYLTKDRPYTYEVLEYKNSAQSKYGDIKRVVGYGAMRIFKQKDEFSLNKSEKKELLKIAKEALDEAIVNNKRLVIDENSVSPKLKESVGAFVTLNKDHKLRGCIGTFEPTMPLYKVVIEMAISAALFDTRFNKVTADELKNIDIEISVLTPRKRIFSLDEITIGKHGIYIKKGTKTGTYLPHVATQMNWNVKEFVESASQEKAKLGKDGYKDAELYIYEAIVFE